MQRKIFLLMQGRRKEDVIDLERGCCERMEKEEDEKGKRKGAARRGQNDFGNILLGK